MRRDGQTDRQGGKTKLIDAFHNFPKAPKIAYKVFLVGNPERQRLLIDVGIFRSG